MDRPQITQTTLPDEEGEAGAPSFIPLMWVDSKTGGAHAIQSFARLNWDLNTSYYKILNDPEMIIWNAATDSFIRLLYLSYIHFRHRGKWHVTDVHRNTWYEKLTYVVISHPFIRM